MRALPRVTVAGFGSFAIRSLGFLWRAFLYLYKLLFLGTLIFFALYMGLRVLAGLNDDTQQLTSFAAIVLAPLSVLAFTCGLAINQGEHNESDSKGFIRAGEHFFASSILFLFVSGIKYGYQFLDINTLHPILGWVFIAVALILLGVLYLSAILSAFIAFIS